MLSVTPGIQEQETKHKTTAQCLNSCIKWTLNVSTSPSQVDSISLVTSSHYFKKLDSSILNILQTNNNSNGHYKNIIDNLSGKSNEQLEQLHPSSLLDILKIKYPIDNTAFNFLIIDANLGIKDNLNNIFFIEFDISGNEFDSISKINDDCVEKELFFSLNGTFHDSQLFKANLQFSVEYRGFIKSIQFRLQNYKNQMVNKKKYKYQKLRKNHINDEIGNVPGFKSFYAKILSNINIGIEFSKPTTGNDYEFFHTNFNSIVNSNIKIQKIFLEISIPKMFIEGKNVNLASMKQKINISEIKEEKKITPPSSVISTNADSNSQTYSNDFERMLYKQHNSPTIGIRNNYPFHSHQYRYPVTSFYSSPPLPINITQTINPSQLIYSPLSPMISPLQQTPFYPQTIFTPVNNQHTNVSSQRRFSENVFGKIKENPLSKMTHHQVANQLYHHPSSQTPVIMRINNEDFLPKAIPVQPFISPRTIESRPISNVGINNNNYVSMNNPMVQTIQKFILNWEKINEGTKPNLINKNIRTSNTISSIDKDNKKSIHHELYNNYTNFEIFIESCSPKVNKHNINMIKDITLLEYIKCFSYVSLFGNNVTYFLNKEIISTTYTITLSSFEIKITSTIIIQSLISDIMKVYPQMKLEKEQTSLTIGNLSIYISHKEIIFSFNEIKPSHFRQIFIKEMQNIFNTFPTLKTIKLNDISNVPSSHLSILFSPIKLNKRHYMHSTSFLVFYNFCLERYNDKTILNKYYKMKISGILPIKYDIKSFMTKISNNNLLTSKDNDNLLLSNIINSAIQIISASQIKSNYDYEQYIKNEVKLNHNNRII